jgi:hypothetical protein
LESDAGNVSQEPTEVYQRRASGFFYVEIRKGVYTNMYDANWLREWSRRLGNVKGIDEIVASFQITDLLIRHNWPKAQVELYVIQLENQNKQGELVDSIHGLGLLWLLFGTK